MGDTPGKRERDADAAHCGAEARAAPVVCASASSASVAGRSPGPRRHRRRGGCVRAGVGQRHLRGAEMSGSDLHGRLLPVRATSRARDVRAGIAVPGPPARGTGRGTAREENPSEGPRPSGLSQYSRSPYVRGMDSPPLRVVGGTTTRWCGYGLRAIEGDALVRNLEVADRAAAVSAALRERIFSGATEMPEALELIGPAQVNDGVRGGSGQPARCSPPVRAGKRSPTRRARTVLGGHGQPCLVAP